LIFMAQVKEAEVTVDGVRTFYRRVPGDGVPVVYCHGNPTHGEDWLPFMQRGGPSIAIDMPGWGRSDRPDPQEFDYSMYGLSAFLDRCLEQLGVERRKLVVHDWGGLALIGAQRRPELVEKLVIVDAVPLLPGYKWHWVAQIWRRRPLGELFNAINTRAGAALALRQASGTPKGMPEQFVDMIWKHMDRGTERAILRLYRHADPDRLAAAGEDLGGLHCTALVVWGAKDPYLRQEWGRAYAQALPNAELDIRDQTGHWPWIDDPGIVDRVLSFLS
jgi:pimeloyl-ACP methyl ester carboxylesterase